MSELSSAQLKKSQEYRRKKKKSWKPKVDQANIRRVKLTAVHACVHPSINRGL